MQTPGLRAQLTCLRALIAARPGEVEEKKGDCRNPPVGVKSLLCVRQGAIKGLRRGVIYLT